MANNKILVAASTILNLLLNRHSEDICIPECKSGQSWVKAGSMKRFDLWVMKKSYSQPMTWIYEIKVSRQDFLKDNKWQTYLPYCSDFYFVAPHGIIDPAEVPTDAGLLLSSKNGTRLYCKKKAPHRTDVKIPISLYLYILMSRSKIVDSTYTNTANSTNKTYWQQWLGNKIENQSLGHNVSRKIRQLYDKNVKFVKMNQERLECRIERLEDTKRILKEMGFEDPDDIGWNREEKIRERIAEINAGLPEKDVLKHLENAILNLQNTIKVIQDSG